MTKLNQPLSQIVTQCITRWKSDLREVFQGVTRDPFAKGRGRRWDRDFGGEIVSADIHYAAFLVVLSLIPAAVVAYTSRGPQIDVLMQFFHAPLQVVLSGFLSSSLIFLGSHLNRVAREYPVAFKLMLRLMAIYPLLGLLNFWKYGEPLGLLIYGFFLIRGVRRTYAIPLQNALLFFGIIYFTFSMMQLQSFIFPTNPIDRFQYLVPPRGE